MDLEQFKESLKDTKWSEYQAEHFWRFKYTDQNILSLATAGSGKTTTLMGMLHYKDPSSTALIMAFNKTIAGEFKAKVKDQNFENCEVGTIHSVGLAALKELFAGKVYVDNGKVYSFVNNLLDKRYKHLLKSKDWNKKKIYNRLKYNLYKYYSYLRKIDCKTTLELDQFLQLNGIVASNIELKATFELHEMYINDFENCLKYKKSFKADFDDMIYWAATREDVVLEKYDIVFLDEAQDANKLMQNILFKSLKENGRFIAVGDVFQSIYGFQGSDPKVINNLRSRGNVIELTLPLSYRCSENVTYLASLISPNMKFYPSNKGGEVGMACIMDHAQPNDYVLCRNNKPLFLAWMELTFAGKPARIKDADLGKQFIKKIESSIKRNMSLNEFFLSLDKDIKSKTNDLRSRGIEDPNNTRAIKMLKERLDIFKDLVEGLGSRTLEDLLKSLKEVFTDKKGDMIELMSVHKSKGLEAENVFLINSNLLPSRFAQTAEMVDQEKNLLFVAITRAKNNFYVDPNNFFSVGDKTPPYTSIYELFSKFLIKLNEEKITEL